MSLVEKLSISGIRSFGQDSSEKQEIIFKSPVTLILGANGCGKTTIIECLKFALTGEVPPGTNKGQSFVHDPKISKCVESLGQAKLRVRDVDGRSLTVSRSMKTYFQGGKLKFQNMGNTLHLEVNSKVTELTHRCVDVTTEMCRTMGVSKAIINNVIFCHQEDSNWPLDEGKKLKEKFDAIFGTTEYNKAIEKIIKQRKKTEEEVKLKEGDLKYALLLKSETESKQLSLKGSEEKLNKLEAARTKLETELEPVMERLVKIEETERDLSKICRKQIEYQTQLDNCNTQQASLKSKIKKIFTGSLEMLEIEIVAFKSEKQLRKEKFEEMNNELTRFRALETRIVSKLSDLEKRRYELCRQRQQEQDLLAERSEKIKDLCDRLSVPVGDIEFESHSQSLVNVQESIKSKLKAEEKQIRDLAQSHDTADLTLQNSIDGIREKKASVENEIESKQKQVDTIKRDRQKVDNEVRVVESSAQKLKSLSEKINQYNTDYDNQVRKVNLDEMKINITTRKQNRDKLQERLDKIDEEITFLNSISKITAEIGAREKHLENRESEAKRIKAKHSENLKKLSRISGKPIESNYKRSVESLRQKIDGQITDLNSTIKRLEISMTEYKTQRVNYRGELSKLEKEFTDGNEKVFDQCGTSSFQEVLDKLKEQIEKTQNDFGAFKSSNVLYKRYINLMEGNPCCPLCHKDMTNNDVTTLSAELQDEIRLLPEKIDRTGKQLKELEKKRDSLLTLKPLTERIEKLKVDLPKQKEKLKDIEQKLTDSVNEFESLQLSIAEPEYNLQTVNSLIGDMSLLDESLKDIERISKELADLKSKLPENRTTMSLDDAQTEKSTINAEFRHERQTIDKLENEYERETKKLNSLREMRNKLKEEQIKLNEGVQNLAQLKLRLEELSRQIDAIMREKSNLEMKLPPLKRELEDAIKNKEVVRDRNRTQLSAAQNRFTEMKNVMIAIEKCSESLSSLEELNIAQEIENVKRDLLKYKEDQTSNGEKIKAAAKEIDKLREEIASHEINERDLSDNRELKKLETTKMDLSEKLNEVEKSIGTMKDKSFSKMKDSLLKMRDDITSKRSQIAGQKGEVQAQIESMMKELAQGKYKNSLTNYRKTFYEVEVTKAILHDLKVYIAALEWALIEFHSEKMRKINQLIREYWRSIYRGNDIDYVEIKTEESSTATASTRRNYNYRVVQSKNDVELDMRGRCSAGQRVLACLIIRVALAETFSANCGVLALDEPTTNLDRANILSLCDVLSRIIEERQVQANFMLIIITHDEEFVNTLGNIDSFYKLYRNNDGKSVIQKVRSH